MRVRENIDENEEEEEFDNFEEFFKIQRPTT